MVRFLPPHHSGLNLSPATAGPNEPKHMALLLGQHEHSLDSKDRVTIPSKFRHLFSEGMVLSADFEPCVSVFTPEGFDEFQATFKPQLHPLNTESRKMKRRIFGNAAECELDTAGRARIPKNLLEHASIEPKGRCIVVGAGDHIEIWSEQLWGAEKEETDTRAIEFAESLSGPAGGETPPSAG